MYNKMKGQAWTHRSVCWPHQQLKHAVWLVHYMFNGTF